MVNETDLLQRFPDVKQVVKIHPKWIQGSKSKNKILFACLAVSETARGLANNTLERDAYYVRAPQCAVLDCDGVLHEGKIFGVREGHSNYTPHVSFPNTECVNVQGSNPVKRAGAWVHFLQ